MLPVSTIWCPEKMLWSEAFSYWPGAGTPAVRVFDIDPADTEGRFFALRPGFTPNKYGWSFFEGYPFWGGSKRKPFFGSSQHTPGLSLLEGFLSGAAGGSKKGAPVSETASAGFRVGPVERDRMSEGGQLGFLCQESSGIAGRTARMKRGSGQNFSPFAAAKG